MVNLKRVTITGADDSTDISQLMDLSTEFPFVEWAILVSRAQEGGFRFPSRRWITDFCVAAEDSAVPVHISTHICGRFVRELLVGKLNWNDVPVCLDVGERAQINTHAEEHQYGPGLIACMEARRHKEFIFQLDGVNEHLTGVVSEGGFSVSGLYDTSHGAGILPSGWPSRTGLLWYGYAGGLGPENVAEQLPIIEMAAGGLQYWIDMERRVRTDDDRALDMAKVRPVLEQAKMFMFGTAV